MIDSSRAEPQWPWVLGFSAPKAARYQAATLARLDDLSGARSAFAAAAPALVAPRPRAHAQVDHARALARAGHVEEARMLATEALIAGHQFGLELVLRQVRALPRLVADTLADADYG